MECVNNTCSLFTVQTSRFLARWQRKLAKIMFPLFSRRLSTRLIDYNKIWFERFEFKLVDAFQL